MTETDFAYAKINISLDIVSKMPDGYHEMLMVMQSVSLCDELTVECVSGEGVRVESGLLYLPRDERNIAAKAALEFYAYTGITGFETRISITKNIPVCAGLGGGSSDGACVLRMLNRMFKTGLSRETLEELGAQVGADVPFCVAGGTSLAKGRGGHLTDLAQIPQCHIVICKPPFALSTPELFGRIRCDKIRSRPDTKGIVKALGRGDLDGSARRMYNVFEDVLPRGERDITDIKLAMIDHGALGAVMTGSGPTVFGIFDNSTHAQNTYNYLKLNYQDCFFAMPTEKIDT